MVRFNVRLKFEKLCSNSTSARQWPLALLSTPRSMGILVHCAGTLNIHQLVVTFLNFVVFASQCSLSRMSSIRYKFKGVRHCTAPYQRTVRFIDHCPSIYMSVWVSCISSRKKMNANAINNAPSLNSPCLLNQAITARYRVFNQYDLEHETGPDRPPQPLIFTCQSSLRSCAPSSQDLDHNPFGLDLHHCLKMNLSSLKVTWR